MSPDPLSLPVPSSLSRLRRCGLIALVVATGVLTGPILVSAADASPAVPAPSALPGPAPTCTPEVEPNDLPEDAPQLSSAVCLTGVLPEVRDQDLVLWDVEPAEALITWRITVEGIPTTITSIRLFDIVSEPGVQPIDAREMMRVDSDADTRVPGVASGVSLKAGQYLLGISRGDPADRTPNPPGEYRVAIEREQALPASGDVEPNDDATSATAVRNPIALTGDAIDRNVDLYRWTIMPDEAATPWQLDVRGVIGDYLAVRLLDAEGTEIATTDMPRDGAAHLYDLHLDAGDYLIEMTSTTDGSLPYVLTSQPAADPLADAEPNDERAQALPLDIGEELTGRLAGPGDVDHYHFDVPQTLVASQLDVALRVGSSVDRRVCLLGPDLAEVQCRQGRGDIVLSNLSLVGGTHLIEVSGTEDLADHYRLAVTDAGPIVADREIEPNDVTLAASPWDAAVVMRGRSLNNDQDYFRLVVTGEPQVWRLDATGTDIRSLLWLEPDREIRGTGDISADGTRASLWDIYLVPGQHWIGIEAEGEDYTLSMTPLGPLAIGSEREPNNDANNAEPIDLGEPRAGRLTGSADADVYRFSLEAAEHVVLHLDPPADGAVTIKLLASGTELMRLREPAPGIPLVYDAFLPIGDYEVTLQSDSGSVLPYELLVERADPYLLPVDLEPNDVPRTARDLPLTLHVDGMGRGIRGEDDDWYRIAAPPDPSLPLVVTTTGSVTRMELTDGVNGVGIDPDVTGTIWTSRALPVDVPLYLHITSGGDYALDVTGAGLVAEAPPPELPLEASLVTAATEVAAYERFGQRVGGTLTLTNTGEEPLSVTLDGVTTDTAWTVGLEQDSVEIPAASSVDVPLTIGIQPDAWADVPTRISIRAASDDGRLVTASADITPGRDALPVGAEQAWPIPDALLGGLDAASLALGATIVSPTFSEVSERLLHDGLALEGTGFVGSIGQDPVTFTVDLATEDLVPVRGVIIDPLAGRDGLGATPRAFELLLSTDGTTWDVATSGELSPRQEDQAFVLDAPIPARFAQLRIGSTWAGAGGTLELGEWQVVATPGWASAQPINVADPANGGHIVRTTPGATSPSQVLGMLDEAQDPNHWEPYMEPDLETSWVVGFRDGRAAEVTELQWVDPADSDPAQRFDQVAIQVSTETPLGPWQDVGTWDLTRAADGSVPSFVLQAPTWARYVRFAGAGLAETGYREMPTTIRVIERATDDTYRSILGTWGRNEPSAILELLQPPDLSGVAAPIDLTDGNDTADTASLLAPDVSQDARIQRGKDVDWYELVMPADMNTLELTIGAPAAAGLVPTLHDANGALVELVEGTATVPDTARYFADVEPGQTYRVLVEQPPFSTAFIYDTSGSLATYLAYISTALRGFAEDVTPGEEAVWIMPFEDPPLLREWSDDTYALQDAVAGVASVSGSSAAEQSLIAAAGELQERVGTHAIVVITDAETSSYQMMGDLWPSLESARPIVFAVHVAGGDTPQLTTNLMQDWAHSWGGHYEYAASHGQLDRAFDRLATWLRRPAAYTIGYSPSFVSRAPGGLSIMPPAGPDGDQSVVAGTGVGVEILFDTSGSMLKKIGKERRIDIARDVLTDLITETLPSGLPVAVRIFDRAQPCGTKLLAPLAPLDNESLAAQVRGLKIARQTKTPLGAILAQVGGDLAAAMGPKIIVLITDGQETCGGDAEQVIRELIASGVDVRVNIVGFAIDDEDLKAQFERWAEAGHGQVFDAQSARELAAGIASALRAPFQVYDKDDLLVATGFVGEGKVELPPGSYRVEILTDPVIVLEDVIILPAESRTIQLEAPTPTP